LNPNMQVYSGADACASAGSGACRATKLRHDPGIKLTFWRLFVLGKVKEGCADDGFGTKVIGA